MLHLDANVELLQRCHHFIYCGADGFIANASVRQSDFQRFEEIFLCPAEIPDMVGFSRLSRFTITTVATPKEVRDLALLIF